MGSASSKLRKHLQTGDEVQALRLYRSDSELRKALDPNCSYGDSHQHETPLHLAARNGMQTLLGIFLFSKGGNPNKTNSRKETALHCVCMENNSQSLFVCNRRAMCLNYLLKWRGAKLEEGQVEKVDLAAQDEKLNTALHYAAASGLTQCVEILIQVGAPLFLENEDSFTPCDTAERNGHASIALYLESKMVFSNDDEVPMEDDNNSMPPVEEYTGLRPQDLQEAKDQLLVETADMLSVPLFTAEALLRNHEWSRENLLEAWMTDPVACCDKCGVMPPPSLFSEKPEVQENLASPVASMSTHSFLSAGASSEAECDICAEIFLLAEEPVHMTCSHRFCKHCWEKYLNLKIQEGDAHHITCPAYGCSMLVPVDVIEGIVSRDMALRYLQFDIKAFVDSNPDMKWCPAPGCGRAVKLPDIDGNGSTGGAAGFDGGGYGARRSKIPQDTSRGVDCGMGHYFCWECLEESHEPCSCENWTKWFQKISEVKPETLDGTEQETELAANCLWLVTNSKACPNCKSPIQKNEGCNHMKCSKCKYDFCWVCLEPWKRHNTSTGGYFKCNRFEIVKKVEAQNAQMVTEAETKNKHVQELNRFVHYYSRFKNHENSYKLEEPLLKTAKDKMMKLAEAVTDNATANTETRFVEDAVQQLLKARRMLKCSYVYGFYLDGPGYKKIVFEFMQTELEECTEILSQMVNRLYLRTPRRRIVEQARAVQRKRLEFVTAISKGLVPPETPPSARKAKKKKKSSTENPEDEDLRKAILASIQEVDPANPWIKDASGRHTNVATLLEWPAEDSDESEGEAETKEKHERIGKCHRAGCNKVRAKNPKTNEIHDYCSMWCLLIAQEDENKEEGEGLSEIVLDEHMELLRALEMSRLQYLQDSGLLHVPRASQDMESPEHGPAGRIKKRSQLPRDRSNSGEREDSEVGAVGRAGATSGLSSMEELDIELQRFQELSASAFPTRDPDMTHMFGMAYGEASKSSTESPSRSSRLFGSKRDEVRSTVVPRVPNKSVEDLYRLDQPHAATTTDSCDSLDLSLPAGTKLSGLEQGETIQAGLFAADVFNKSRIRVEADVMGPCLTQRARQSATETEKACGARKDLDNALGLFGSTFGAIKDISISNIHANEKDKTKEFLSKDLAAIFSGWDCEEKEEAAKSSTASALVSAETSSSFEELTLLPLPDLRISSSPEVLEQAEPIKLLAASKRLGHARRPLTLGTPGLSLSENFEREIYGEQSAGKKTRSPRRSSSTSAASKGKGPASKYSLNIDQDLNVGENRNANWAERRCREKYNSKAPYVDKVRSADQKLADTGAEDNSSLLEMAENLLQMTADVHSRMKEVGKGIQGFAEDMKFVSNKTEEASSSQEGKEKSRARSGKWRDNSGGKLGCHKLLGKDKETRILVQLPKSTWSLHGEGHNGNERNSYGFECPEDPPHWALDSDGLSSRSCSSLRALMSNSFSGAKDTVPGADVSKRRTKHKDREESSKSSHAKTSGKSKKKRAKPQAEAIMSDAAGESHAVPVAVVPQSSPSAVRKSSTNRLSLRGSDDLLHPSPGLHRHSEKSPAHHPRNLPKPASLKLDKGLEKANTRELQEDEYASLLRESASSLFLSLPSPPAPAPPSPSLQSVLKQPEEQHLLSSLTHDQTDGGEFSQPGWLVQEGKGQGDLQYCLRRNIDSESLQPANRSPGNGNDETEVIASPVCDDSLTTSSVAATTSSTTVAAAAASALTVSDHYNSAASDVDSWEDASESLENSTETKQNSSVYV